MKKLLASCAALCLVASGFAVAGELKSGLEEGAHPGAFNVKDVTGPEKGKSLCYRCKYGSKPTVTVFTRELNDEVAALVKGIDKVVAKNQDQKLSAFVVLLTDDPDAAEPKLEAFAKKQNIKNVPLTIYDGAAGPPTYKIAKDANLNVMMWVDSNVKVNHAFKKGEFNKKIAQKVVKDTGKILN